MGRNRTIDLGLKLALIALAISSAACVQQTRSVQSRARTREMLVNVPSMRSPVTTGDIRRASYAVIYGGGDSRPAAVYNVAYVQRAGDVSIIEGETGFRDVRLTSTNIPSRVKELLLMGPIVGIVGDRRSFTVGQTYDSVMLRPDGQPHFRYTCDRMQEVAGISGYHLTVRGLKSATPDMEVVVSNAFPFPLYVREYSGGEPISISLMSRARTKISENERPETAQLMVKSPGRR